MTVTYTLAPMPKWIIMANNGLVAGGAKLRTKRHLNKVEDKAVYQDPAGAIPWTNPVIFDANGTRGPFYWEVDSDNPDETYYLEFLDSNDNPLFDVDNFFPPGGGGGGSSTTYLPLKNLIANNVFIEHINNTSNPTNVTNLVVAPSNHRGFTPDLINPVVGTWGVVGPDIRFVKNNTNATDQITFEPFTLGSDPLTGDVTPVEYLRYQCTNSPVGETYKSFQFPICHKVNNLDNQSMTFTCWAKVAVTPQTVTVYARQYFGSGGSPSAEVRTSVGTMSLTTAWTKFNITLTVPNTSGKTLGDCGDDALYIQLDMPLGAPCDIWFTKPSLYLGNIGSFEDFDTYDEINCIISSPRSADISTSLRGSAKLGYVAMNDGTIGSSSSGATTRAHIDTFPVYKFIWDQVTDSLAPVVGGRGASAVADFAANKAIYLTKSAGRVLSNVGPPILALTFTADTSNDELAISNSTSFYTGTPVTLTTTGTLPAPLALATTYYAIHIDGTHVKLATTLANAVAGTAIDITTTGVGTHTMTINYSTWSLAQYAGEYTHALTTSELASHRHNYESSASVGGGSGGSGMGGGSGRITEATGGSTAHNNMQPTAFYPVYLKL